MNATRKADLQRKLAMTEVPKPPAGLAERIKNDIPSDLGTATTRGTGRGGFAMRIAASLLIVVSSVYVGTRLLSRNPADVSTHVAPRAASRSTEDDLAKKAAEPQPASQAGVAAAVSGNRIDSLPPIESRPAAQIADSSPARSGAEPQGKKEDGTRDSKDARVEQSIAYAPAPAAPAAAPAPLTIAPPPPAATAAAAPAPARTAVAESRSARSQQITREEAAAAAKIASAEHDAAVQETVGGVLAGTARSKPERIAVTGPPATAANAPDAKAAGAVTGSIARSRFGISTDPLVVERIRQALERGERPGDVNVEALVNYFAGGSEETISELTVSVEGSPAPVAVNASQRLVRVSVDAPMSAGLAAKQVATDVQLAVRFDSTAVASYRLVGGNQLSSAAESAMFENNSVTALFEIVLKPGARNRQPIVRADLQYRDMKGREHSGSRVLKLGDFRQVWPDASRRHRLASLGAIWGETLEGDTSGADVAKRAEELANQEPRDAKARELAQLANASSRLRSSGPTGSGR